MDEIEVLEKPQMKQLTRLLTPNQEQSTVTAVVGETVQELIDRAVQEELREYVIAFNHGSRVTNPAEMWITESDNLLLTIVPQGGKDILRGVLMVAVVAIAAVLAAPTGGMSLVALAGFTGTSAVVAGAVLGTAISMVGMMAINALIPPAPLTNGAPMSGTASSPTYSVGGQSNSMRKYQPVARVYGRHKVFPQLAANPLITNFGTESSISALYDFGLGDLEVEDLRIGDAAASTFNPELIWHKNSYVENTTFLTNRVGYDQYTYELQTGSAFTIRTKQATTAFDVDLTFPAGLGRYDNQNNLISNSVYVNAQYRLLGETVWRDIPAANFRGVTSWEQSDALSADALKWLDGKAWSGDPNQRIGLSGATTQRFTAVISVTPPEAGEFEFRIIRGSDNSTDNRVADDMAVTMMKSYKDGSVVNLDKRHTMLEMKVIASDKLSGTIQNLSAIATSILRTTTDGINFVNLATNNPAWIALDILTSEGNRKPVPDSLIDWDSFIRLAAFCEKHKYTANFIVDHKTTVQELLASVLSTAHASTIFTSTGKYGVLIDEERNTPRQLITPANSWGFTGNRSFTDQPHAFLVTFINGEKSTVAPESAPDITWQKDERIVYNTGYDETNATVFETLETFGITNPDQAWKYGRYMMAQGVYRSEVFTVNMDLENLVVQRGDLVYVANDVAKIGGMPARVVSVNGNVVEVDQTLSVQPNGYSIRLNDGTVRSGAIINASPAQYGTLLTLDNTTGIYADDLIILGVVERVIGKYIVQQITPGSNLTAELQLVKYAPEVYLAETGEIPEWNAEMSQSMIDSSTLYVKTLEATQSFEYKDRKPFASISLSWSVGGFGYAKGDVYVSAPGQNQIYLGSSTSLDYTHLVDLLANPKLVGVPWTFEVIPLTANGEEGKSAFVDIVLQGDTMPPAIVDGFTVNVQSETINLSWIQPSDQDISYYELRYTPDTINPDWKYSQQLAIVPWNTTQTSVGARTGTYMMRTVDTSSNVSDVVYRRTTVGELPNVEIITTINDKTFDWYGDLHGFVKVPGDNGLELVSSGDWGNVSPRSEYYFNEIVDFTSIFEARVASKIQAHGEYADGTPAPTEKWACWLEMRSTGQLDFLTSWGSMSGEADMIGTSDAPWSEWRPVTVGDTTSKLLQFRIVAQSYSPDVKVFVTDGSVTIDAMDRYWSDNNLTIPTGLNTINIDPPFMFDDIAVAISIDGNDIPLVSRVTNKTRSSFDIELRNALTDAPESGRIDVIVRGQGRERTTSI